MLLRSRTKEVNRKRTASTEKTHPPQPKVNAMPTMNKNAHRTLVSLKLPTQVTALITYAQGIVKAMTGNPAYPNPLPTLAAVTTATNDLQAAHTASLTRAKGTAAVRNEKHAVLVTLLLHLKAYIQAQADANAENATSIIESAGVGLRKPPTHHARVFAAKAGALSGTADLVAAPAGRRAAYEWEFSTDGGKTWLPAPPTLQAKTTVSGLPSGTTALFRYRSVTKTGASDWSAAVSLLVH
jgi:hypothetical protein